MRRPALLCIALAVALALVEGIATAQPGEPSPPAPVPSPVVPPRLLSDPGMPYPEGVTGDATVILVITVEKDGGVRDVTTDATFEPFATVAMETARRWTFEPATRDGAPLASKIRVVVEFRPPKLVTDEEAAAALGKAREAPPPTPAPRPEEPQEVRVRGVRSEPSRTVSLSRNEVRQIPGAFGDPFRALEIMPGVTPVVTGLPFFFVRGAPPGNVGYYLDGVRVPLLFHVGVGPSVVHPALVERVDLYPGGYPARFGRFSGGIVSGETMAAGPDPRGEFNLRLFDVGALAETPFADGRGAVLVGGRYSYTGALLSLLSSDTELAYWDYQARASYDLSRDDRIGVFAFGSYDYLGQKTPTETLTLFGTEFHRVDVRYDHRLGDAGVVRTAVTTGLDRSRLEDDRYTRDRMIAARTELTYHLSDRVAVRAGSDVQFDSYDVQLGGERLAPGVASVASYFPSRSDLAVGVRADAVLAPWRGFEITPGARVDLYTSQGAAAVGVDPRVAMRAALTSRARLLSAIGLAHQTPSFVVPVPGFTPGGLRGGLQKALQESMGLELDLGGATTLTATVYHNAFFDMSDPLGVTEPTVSGCPPGRFPTGSLAGDRAAQPSGTPTCNPRFTPGTIGPDRSGGGGDGASSAGTDRATRAFEVRTKGSAYGLELFVKRKLTSRLGGFLSYTLSRSTRTFDGRTYIATFDRTHVLNAALAFDLGKNWRAGTRFTFYTGLPKAEDPENPDDTRLSPFYRVDLRLEKRWQIGRKGWLSVVAEWMNATMSTEEISTTCTLQGCSSQTIGPVTIPSLGLEGGF